MTLADETAGLEEVAGAMGRTAGWLRRHWLKLHLEHGFPRKIPGAWVWPRRSVEAWLRSAGLAEPAPLPANQNGAGVDLVAQAAAMLRQRYGAST